MKKNKIRIPILILVLSAITYFIAIQPSSEKYAVDISFPLVKSMDYLRDPKKISQWMEPFASDKLKQTILNHKSLSHAKDTLQILTPGYIDVIFRRSNATESLEYLVEASPKVDSPYISRFVVSYQTPLWKNVLGKNQLAGDIKKTLDDFKAFMENPLKLYGFNIREIQVMDTSFLYASRTVPSGKFTQETKSLFDLLISEAQKRNAAYNGVRIFHYEEHGNGTTSLYAGVGVSKRVETKEGDNVTYKMMPYMNNLLVADFEGPYKDIHKAYKALELYKEDYKRVSMAIPFHKYMNDGYGFSDTQIVKMRVTYPVF